MDDFKDLIELFVLISQESSSISTDLVFTIKDLERYQLLVQEIKNKNQSYDDTLSNTEIKIVSAIPPGLHIYADFESYNNRVKEEFFKETILILSHDPEPIIISTVNNTKIAKYYYSGAEDIRLLNRYYLFIIIHFLESICDYNDTVKGFLYFLSPECGKFILKIPSNSKLGTYNQDYQKSIESIQRIQKNPAGYEPILKNKIIRGLELLPDENKFLQLATNLNCFIDATIKDFEIFINTSNHESILVKFELEKSQFVEEVRQVLERISSSVLAVPISFAAALFAIKDVSNLWMLSILKFSFLLFTIFSSIINIFYFFELNNIKKEIAVKINFYSSNILFIKNELENKMNGTKLKATFLQFLTICVILLFIVFIVVFFTLRIQESTSSAIELQCIL